MTVKEFIRDIRLKRAIQLLDQKKLNVSEVAYAVGLKICRISENASSKSLG